MVGNNHVVWFQASNKYIIISSLLNKLITLFLASVSFETFKNKVIKVKDYTNPDLLTLYNDIEVFLNECNQPKETLIAKNVQLDKSQRKITNYYKIHKLFFEIHFSSEKLKSIIHPQLEHLEIKTPKHSATISFDIYHKSQQLYLFKNEIIVDFYTLKENHLLQGKFAMKLLCAINNNKESDWIGTFHASTVRKQNKSSMLIGASGSGKSTFTALLMADGFNLVADDITPILSKDKKIYSYPAAVSIKSGAFATLNKIIPKFDELKEHYINPFKGNVKYFPSKNTDGITNGYKCHALVYINYNKDCKTTILENLDLSEALNILIPESWLEPSKENAKRFLEWLQTLRCYKLTYSNNNDAITKFSELF